MILKDNLMSLRAKRRNLTYKWEENAFELRKIENALKAVMDTEEKIEDELERRREDERTRVK